jgi:hypothetical protein
MMMKIIIIIIIIIIAPSLIPVDSSKFLGLGKFCSEAARKCSSVRRNHSN